MRVIYDLQAHTFGPHGGVARMLNATIETLSSDPDFSAFLFCPARPAATLPMGPHVRKSLWKGLPAALRAKSLPRKIYHAMSEIYWRCHPADIYHPSFYPEDATLFRLKTVVNIYDLVHENIPMADDVPDVQRLLLLKKRAVEHADRILCISEATRTAFLAHYKADPAICRVVPLATGPAFQRLPPEVVASRIRPLRPDPQRPFILFVGARHRYKNFHRLLAAYQRWPRNRDIDLLVVGSPQRSSDATLHDITPGTGTIIYIPFPSDETLCALYHQALFFVYPSLNEGFGIPLLEAMASGCPLCIADIPVFREVATPVSTFFDPLSVDAITNALEEALPMRDNPRRNEAHEKCLSRYSWAECANNIHNIYKELLCS